MQTVITNNYRPSKYDGKTFEEALNLAKGLERSILTAFLKNGFVARGDDDLNPFLLPMKQSVRGLDVFCFKNGFSFFADAKDYSRLLFHPATGIPINLYERYKAIQENSGIKIMIFFQDHCLKTDEPIGEPYGGFMDNFIKYKRQDIKHKCKTKEGKVYFTAQVIWRCESMFEIGEFLRFNFWEELVKMGIKVEFWEKLVAPF